MAYTEAQWNKQQATLPPEDRMSYIDYIQQADPAQYNRIVGAVLQNLKVLETTANATTVVDERTKAAGAKTDTAAQKAATIAAGQVVSNFKASEAASGTPTSVSISAAESAAATRALAAEDAYFTVKVGDTGKTQAQLDALTAANRVATIVGGTVDANGKVIPPLVPRTPEELAAGLEAADAKDAEIDATGIESKTAEQIAADNAATDILGEDGNNTGEPPNKPGNAWIVSPDGKSWIKPPMPTDGKKYNWDDNNGWVLATDQGGGPGNKPGNAWVLSADGKSWVKPPMPTDGKKYNWDDNNGWVLSTDKGDGPGKQPGKAWVLSADGKSWVKPPMPTDGKTYTWNDDTGWVLSQINTAEPSASQVDSIAAISALLSSYGIGDLSDAIAAAVKKGYSASTIQLIMQDPNSNDPLAVAFQQRFPANKARMAAGKSVLSAAEYLAAERTYAQVFQSYGMSSLAKREMYNKFIAGDVSAAEVSDRVGLAVNRVQNADADTKKALAQYYPMLNQNDIVSAMLDPEESLPALQRKVQIGEIGGAALAQGLTASLKSSANQLGATALAELGVTKEQARTGFAQVAEVTPRGEFLSSISAGADYGRLQAEEEAFKKSASAKQAREKLTELEQSRFAGKAGTIGSKSFASQQRGAGLI